MMELALTPAELATATFALLTVFASSSAAFVQDMRKALLGLWVAGLAAGAMYLTVGQELLAVVQWIAASVTTLTLLFSAALYGDPGKDRAVSPVRIAGPALLGLGFVILIWFGGISFRTEESVVPSSGSSLATLGHTLLERHLVAIEIVALLFLAATIGAGVLTRKIRGEESK
jgi:NADH:ubiquinone oxidoreductase subunit 6 (subunit J)